MIQRFIARNNIALMGCIFGLSSLALGWLTLRSSRIVAGNSLSLWESFGSAGSLTLVVLWVTCLILSLILKTRLQAILLACIANLILTATFLLAGLNASKLLESEGPFTRVSLGAGIWISLIGLFVLIFAARQRLGKWPIYRNIVTWAGPIILAIILFTGWLNDLSILKEFTGREVRFVQEFWQHIILFGVSVTAGTIIGIPLGIWATRSRRLAGPIFYFTNITQTIPSLALFGLLIAPLSALSFAFPVLRELGIRGIGFTPAIIALIVYSLLPIVRNTYAGLQQLDPSVIDAGLGMGMSRLRVFLKIEVPLSAPLVLEGVRIASVQAVGLATVAALIGAGGLGWFVFQGLGQQAADLILLGALPIIGLALLVDGAMRIATRAVTPKGLMKVNDDPSRTSH